MMKAVPFLSLTHQHIQIREEMDAAIKRVIDGGQFILGEEVSAFESTFASFSGVQYCAGVGNGLDALVCALKALAISDGDEVIVPSHTCYATWLAVQKAGAKPVPVEVDERTFTIRPELIEQAITSRTKVIIPVHLYGYPCDMNSIMAIARRHHLTVVEDNAQAHGAGYENRLTGSWGDVNATSFYPTKNLGALGDGGAITTNNRAHFDFVKAYSNYGGRNQHFELAGINSRLDEVQAAILRVKLHYLLQWNFQRILLAQRYDSLLKNVGDVVLPPLGDDRSKPVFHLYVIQTNYRDQLQQYLKEQNIGTSIHYPEPIHLQKPFKYLGGLSAGSLPVAERLSQTVLSLPLWPGLTQDQQESVADHIRKFFDHHL